MNTRINDRIKNLLKENKYSRYKVYVTNKNTYINWNENDVRHRMFANTIEEVNQHLSQLSQKYPLHSFDFWVYHNYDIFVARTNSRFFNDHRFNATYLQSDYINVLHKSNYIPGKFYKYNVDKQIFELDIMFDDSIFNFMFTYDDFLIQKQWQKQQMSTIPAFQDDMSDITFFTKK